MKFHVHRTSTYSSGGPPPCEGAVQEGDRWFLEMPTLEALMSLIKSHGRIVIDDNADEDGVPSVEIYDDYRE